MQEFEYKVFTVGAGEELEETLNAYAQEGWRLAFMYVVEGIGGFKTLFVTMERPVRSES